MSELPHDVLAGDPRHRRDVPAVTPTVGTVLELDGFVGAVTAVTARQVTVADRRGRTRHFQLDGQLAWLDERPVSLVAAAVAPRAPAATTTRSGSLAAPRREAGTARASRIWVEGVHDAELLELVWGDDLRAARVVVEPIGGLDDLVARVRAFGPRADRRLGVLADHLVPGSKESRIVAELPSDEATLVVGHPYVDVWEAVKPAVVGIPAWPTVPRGLSWKDGVCAALGVSDPQTMWRRVRGSVRSWRDLEQPLVRAVEQLLDHVTLGD